MSVRTQAFYEFGPFRLNATDRVLLRDGDVVALTPKVYDLLVVLVESGGRMVDKDELMKVLWPDTFVEEGNLTQNISILRKALGEGTNGYHFIETIPKRGYRFVAEVREVREDGVLPIPPDDTGYRIAVEPDGRPVAPRSRFGWAWLVGCIGFVALGIAIYYVRLERATTPPPGISKTKTLAVLPFKVIGAEASNEYLGLGMTDALITRLSNVKQIVVRPTSAVRRYSGSEVDSMAAGREQKVVMVLDGNIRRVDEKIRVTVQLLDVENGRPVWAERFDENFTDVLGVEASIADRVAKELTLKLSGEEGRQLAKRYTENREAYQLYIRGRTLLLGRESPTEAVKLLEEAIHKDPRFALAHAALSHAQMLQATREDMVPGDAWARAEEAAQRAVDLDSGLPEAHARLGMVKMYKERNWPAAERELKRALELNANSAEANNLYGFYLQTVGRFAEAISYRETAMILDPLSLTIKRHAAITYSFAREFDNAIERYKEVLAEDPKHARARGGLGITYVLMGKFEDAIRELTQARNLDDDPLDIAALAYSYAKSGQRVEAEKLLHELVVRRSAGKQYVSPFTLAIAYAGLDNKDAALSSLQKANEERSPNMSLKISPFFESLRSDPRFIRILQEAGF